MNIIFVAQKIFFNRLGRLRSGWRFIVFIMLFVLFGIPLQAAGSLILRGVPVESENLYFLNLLVGALIPLVVALLAGWICGKYLEDLPFRALGAWFTKKWISDLLLGCLFGILTVSLAVLISVVFGGLSFRFNSAAGTSAILITLGGSFVIFFFAAAFEEALFRGYMLQTFTRAGLAWFAIILTSVFFGMGHLGNPNATLISTLNTGLAGIWLGVAYLKTRTLWLVFGLHLFWNWMLGSFYGIEVSGLKEISTAPFLLEVDKGPIWLTGTDYGLEGGIACTIALICCTLVIWFAPIFAPTTEMLALTDSEIPVISNDRTPIHDQ